MAATENIKRALMGIGLLTTLAVGAVAALLAYVWWDSRRAADEDFTAGEYDAGTDFDDGGATQEIDDGDVTADDDVDADADDAEVAAD